jgi:hypothetical protein
MISGLNGNHADNRMSQVLADDLPHLGMPAQATDPESSRHPKVPRCP